LERILKTLGAEMKFDLLALEIMPDHVHLRCEVDPPFGVYRLVKRLKGHTSHALRLEFPSLTSRLPPHWTHAYFVRTVGGAPLAVITQYVEHQKVAAQLILWRGLRLQSQTWAPHAVRALRSSRL
jgi:putative transposase